MISSKTVGYLVEIPKGSLYPVQGFLNLAQVCTILHFPAVSELFQFEPQLDISHQSNSSRYPGQMSSSLALIVFYSNEKVGIAHLNKIRQSTADAPTCLLPYHGACDPKDLFVKKSNHCRLLSSKQIKFRTVFRPFQLIVALCESFVLVNQTMRKYYLQGHASQNWEAPPEKLLYVFATPGLQESNG